MNLVVCPSCGRSAVVEPDHGGRLACHGCGRSLTRLLRAEYPGSAPAAVLAIADPEPDVE